MVERLQQHMDGGRMIEAQASVLVVDDEAAVRGAVERVLARAGFQVQSAPDGASALEALRKGQRFSVIVTDLSMPGIHGTEFLRLLRQIDLDVPVIVLTGNPTLSSAVAVVRYGGFRYLEKPANNELLAQTVREAASLHRLALLKRRALELCESGPWRLGDQAALDGHFDRGLEQHFQCEAFSHA